MFDFLFKKQRRVEKLVFEYLAVLGEIRQCFGNAMQAVITRSPDQEAFGFYLEQTHKFESKADDIIDHISDLMYGKALIPDARQDVMELLTHLDDVPRRFERALYIIQTQGLRIPDFLIDHLAAFVEMNLSCCELLSRQAEALFRDPPKVKELFKEIDFQESRCDHDQRQIITRIFKGGRVGGIEQLQLNELTVRIGQVANRAQRAARLITILSMKRRV